MRYTVAAIILGLATTAHAADHLMHVDEVMLDGGGGEQYIELHDTSAEALPSGPYKLEIYNTSATLVDTITLTGITAGPSVYYVVGNAAADTTYGTATFDATLTNALPNPGQACFVRSNGSKVHCLAWGCNTTLAMTGGQAGPVPPVGSALIRGTTGLAHGTPSPDGANPGGTAVTNNCQATTDAGVVDAPGNPNNADAGTTGGGDDDSGCCETSPRSAPGSALLAFVVFGLVARKRRR